MPFSFFPLLIFISENSQTWNLCVRFRNDPQSSLDNRASRATAPSNRKPRTSACFCTWQTDLSVHAYDPIYENVSFALSILLLQIVFSTKMRSLNSFFLAACLLKNSYGTPTGSKAGLQAPLEDLTAGPASQQVASPRQLHGRFLHITGACSPKSVLIFVHLSCVAAG